MVQTNGDLNCVCECHKKNTDSHPLAAVLFILDSFAQCSCGQEAFTYINPHYNERSMLEDLRGTMLIMCSCCVMFLNSDQNLPSFFPILVFIHVLSHVCKNMSYAKHHETPSRDFISRLTPSSCWCPHTIWTLLVNFHITLEFSIIN